MNEPIISLILILSPSPKLRLALTEIKKKEDSEEEKENSEGTGRSEYFEYPVCPSQFILSLFISFFQCLRYLRRSLL
jgi:hypothetical protein